MARRTTTGVPREVQLTIRNEEGQGWIPRQIWLRVLRYRPEDIGKVRREVPTQALVDGSVWLLFAAFDSDAHVPDT